MDNNQKNSIANENKGRGLFYGIIAVATFIVMAVGATFAYFTATTQSTNSAVKTGSTTLQLKYISYGSAWSRNDLIPADTTIVEYSVESQNDTTTTSTPSEEGVYPVDGNNTMCKDDFGNSICSVYVFQVVNSAASPQSVSLNVVSEKNGFTALNAMAYEISIPTDKTDYDSKENGNGVNDPIFRKNASDETPGVIDVTDGQNTLLNEGEYNPVYINRKGTVKKLLQYVESRDPEHGTTVKKPAIDRLLVSLPTDVEEKQEASLRTAKIADDIKINGGETKTFAIVLYIKNENIDQTASDADKIFKGQVIVSSGDGNTGVSGTISAFGSEENNNLQSNQ